jgi:hypothetical protein
MINIIRNLALGLSFSLPSLASAQLGTSWLDAPSGGPQRALEVAFDGGTIAKGWMRVGGGYLSLQTTNTATDVNLVCKGAGPNDQLVLTWSSSGFSSLQSGIWGVTPRPLVLQGGGGNVGIGTLTPLAELDVNGTTRTTTLELRSDRAAKTDFSAIDGQSVLAKVVALPITSWSYTNAPSVRHLGPMAQDFMAAFGLGESDKHLSVVDGLGVSLAAIQGLNQKLEAQLAEKDARIAVLEKEVASLRTDLVAHLASLEQQFAQSAPAATFSGASRPKVEAPVTRASAW